MRILTVCSSWRVFGAETITLKMLEGFKRRGHDQIAMTSVWTDGNFSQRLKHLGIREESMPLGVVVASVSPRYWKWAAHMLVNVPLLWWRWHRVVRRFKPDVILWTGCKQPMFLLPWLGEPPSYLIEFTNTLPTKSIRWLYRRLAKRFTGFVAVSDFMRGHLLSIGAPAEKIFVIKSGAFFEAERAIVEAGATVPLLSQTAPVRVGIAGQVAPFKGHDCLVEAVRLLKNCGVNLTVEVFGDGDPGYTGRLKEKIQQAGLAELWHWRGYESDKQKIYESFDLCVVPSCFGDPFPTVAMEAGVYRLPVIASRIGGLPEIILDGVTGLLFEPNSAEQLAEKIKWLIDHPQKRHDMGRAGRERVFQHFTVEKMVAEFEMLFNKSPQPITLRHPEPNEPTHGDAHFADGKVRQQTRPARLNGVKVLALFGGTKLFGQERGNIEVFRNLLVMGVEVQVITTSRGGNNEVHRELERQGIPWTIAPFGYTWHRYLLGRHFYYAFLNLWSILAVSWRVRREIRQWRPTHLYTMSFQYFIYAWPALWLSRLPLVWRAGDELPGHTRIHRWLSRQILRRMNHLVCNSEFLKAQFLKYWPEAPPIQVIHNSPPVRIDSKKNLKIPAIPADFMVVTFIGQVSEHKGILVLFDAVEQLIRSGRNIVLWIAGTADWNEGFMERLQTRAAAPELQSRITFLGFVETVDVLLAHSNMHVCPSLFPEPSANVVMEAKFAGIPSVVFPTGGLPELIEHQVDGYLCRNCSTATLREGITYYLDRPTERRQAGLAARNSLEQKFGLGRFQAQWAEVFRKKS